MSAILVSAPIKLDNESSDRELIEGCQQGDARAFDLLIKRHRSTIYSILHKLAPDWSVRHDDLAQDAMIRVYRGIKQLRNPYAFRSWLNQTVTNIFYDELRKKPVLMDISLDTIYVGDDGNESTGIDVADLRSQPDDLLHRKEIWNDVNKAIDRLPPKYKDVIVLREFHGLAYDEIAKMTRAEVGTVKSRLSRARAQVQGNMQRDKARCA